MASFKTATCSWRRYYFFRQYQKATKIPFEIIQYFLAIHFCKFHSSVVRGVRQVVLSINARVYLSYLSIQCFQCPCRWQHMYSSRCAPSPRAVSCPVTQSHAAATAAYTVTILKNIPRVKSTKITKSCDLIYCFGYYKNTVIISESSSRQGAGEIVS